jgi:LytS/YehU family sensor histidine kinase
MGARLLFRLDLPPALADRSMPPMMLISLVENAIKHGLEPVEAGGQIDIRARESAGALHIEVADTGAALDPAAKGGTGLSNIRERLQALYGNKARLVIEERRPRGVVARIELPVSPE